MERRTPLGSRLGQPERAAVEDEPCQAELAGRLLVGPQPAETSSDHPVDDQVQVALEPDHDPLAEPLDPGDGATGGGGDRRVHRAQHKGACDPNVTQHLALDAGAQRLYIDGDVRQLGHSCWRGDDGPLIIARMSHYWGLTPVLLFSLVSQDTARIRVLLDLEDSRPRSIEARAPLIEAARSSDTLLARWAVRGLGRQQRPDLIPVLAGLPPGARLPLIPELVNAIGQSAVREGAPEAR